MCVSKNLQIRGICISGALFLFYAPKFLKCPKIILSFLRYLCFNAKIPHRSAGFLPASFLSMQVGARAHFRTCGSGSGKAASPKHWHDQLLQYLFSTHHKTNSPLEALFFCVIADFNFPVLHKYHSSASGLSIPSEATPSIISVTT